MTGLLDWQNGYLLGTGKTLVTTTGSLRLAGNTTTYRSIERELDVQGATSWTGGIVNLGAGGKLINRGTFTINSNATLQLYTYQSTLSFENQGTLVKKGTGIADIGAIGFGADYRFNSSGNIDVQAGRLNIGGGGNLSGPITSPATLESCRMIRHWCSLLPPPSPV